MSPAVLLAVSYHTENGPVAMRSIISPVDENLRISQILDHSGRTVLPMFIGQNYIHLIIHLINLFDCVFTNCFPG